MRVNTALVVGAGFAGLSAALELARAGVRVTVLEAEPVAGGRAQRFTTPDGFAFDLGPTLIVMTDVLRGVLGAQRFAALGLRRLEPGYRVTWPDGAAFDVSSDVATLLANLERFPPAPKPSRTLRFLADVHEHYLEARAKILERDHSPLSFAAALARPGRFRPWAFGSLERFVRRTFAHPRIVDALTFQPLYLGTSPLRAPALYAMLAVEEIVGGVWYAPGGTGAIVDALVAAARAHGVTFAFGERVVEIATERGRARAARTTAQTYDADAVVVTADRESAMRTFVAADRSGRRQRYGHSACVWYLGLDRALDGPHHRVFLPAHSRAAYAQLDAGMLPDEPLVYACNPAVSDPSVAPVNGAALLLLAVVPHRGILPDIDEERYFERVLRVAERGFGPLRDRIVYRRTRGPAAFERELGLPYGAAFGPDHLLDQMGPFRAPIRHRALANLTFAGSGTHPGSGVPMVLLSGRLAARRLLGAAT